MLRLVKRTSISLVALAIAIIATRAILPSLVLNYVNRVLNRLPEYSGRVVDIDIALIRGAYTIRQFSLFKKNKSVKQPFVSVPETDLSIEWSAIFKGKLVGEIEFTEPVINFVNAESADQQQASTNGDWQGMIRDLFPVKINRAQVVNGMITYRHDGTEDEQSLILSNLDASVENLSNHPTSSNQLPSPLSASGIIQNNSSVRLKGAIDPLSSSPSFNLDLTLAKLPLI